MSEADIALGGDAATKFSSSSASAYGASAGQGAYLSSDQVREYYIKKIEAEEQAAKEGVIAGSVRGGGGGSSALPIGWEERQMRNVADEKQHGVFSVDPPKTAVVDKSQLGGTVAHMSSRATGVKSGGEFGDAEVVLLQVATNTLNGLARTLENRKVELPPEECAALASAMKRAMNAVAGCR
mmetsp:Transcript_37582/g.112661  ORF Transcript_37582/g.112661 Transcript_37582/m.112661 type:complete len:182 (+) Transcript_37582:452-997(+)